MARYLFVLFGPVLVVLARRQAWAVAARPALAAALLLAGLRRPRATRGPWPPASQSVRPGDLVVCTQPEQVPVLHRYLPAASRISAARNARRPVVHRLARRAAAPARPRRAEQILLPRVRALAPGRRVVLVCP